MLGTCTIAGKPMCPAKYNENTRGMQVKMHNTVGRGLKFVVY